MKTTTFLLFIALLIGCNNSTPPEKKPPNPSTPATSASPSKTGGNYDMSRFDAEIAKFVEIDSRSRYAPGCILFVGSSSIRMWESLGSDFEGMPVRNRGFGGATIPEVTQYADKVIFPHRPKTIVIYAGENDIHAGDSPVFVLQSFQAFLKTVRERLPDTEILYLSMKPSLDRWNLWDKMQQGNRLIRDFIKTQDKVKFVDVSKVMLIGKEGKPDPTIFIEDGLHLNKTGYERWTKLIKPLL